MGDSAPTRAAPAGSSKKRSRAVSSLTEEQVQHKRNVDRRAQRAFRQRTKDCIASLEQQFAQTQATANRKEQELLSAREQNKNLTQCLEAVLDLVSTALSHLNDTAQPPETSEDDSGLRPETQTRHSSQAQTIPSSPMSEPDESQANLVATDPGPAPSSLAPIGNSVQSTVDHPVEGHGIGQGNTFNSGCHSAPPISPVANNSFGVMQGHQSARSMSQIGSAVRLPTPSSSVMDAHRGGTPRSAFNVLCSHLAPTCPLDQILSDFSNSRRDMITEGVAIETVIGPQRPTVKALLDTSLGPAVHPLSRIMSGVLSTFPSVHQNEKLAFFYLMCHTMRWQICPTKESYIAMPTWLRPTVMQITVPHAMWIDNIPWPGVRDILIEYPDEYPFELFSPYYSQHVTVNWEYDSLDAIADPDDDCTLHSIFEKHVRKLRNWTVSSEFRDRFPSMTPVIYTHE
ncbi:hypothetical protein B0T10DRAFT_501914 [Thelonectria olida]|uniref:BZIP transcription factor n=1 Tax=Thelonectria olida TaxID=1576542 RepID=A0A9P8VPV9_9HYPO|nr:hypothetical protein B0T10DRAFT_501914 [Thelonectria olida]